MANVWAEVAEDGSIGYMRSQAEGAPGLDGMVQLFGQGGVPLTRIPPAGRQRERRYHVVDGVFELDTAAMKASADAKDRRKLVDLQQRRQAIVTMAADLGPNPPELDQVDADIAEVRKRREDRAKLTFEPG